MVSSRAYRNFTVLLALLSFFAETASAQAGTSDSLNALLANAKQDPLYSYPTELTQGIIPKAIHSHNDYWRDVPFYSALSVGAISVEVDVWLYNETLYVGHERAALTSARTLKSLYIDPLLDTLRRQNPPNPFDPTKIEKNGVYDTSAGQPFHLWIDVKTDGPTTWPFVVRALEPLRQGNWLSAPNANGSGIVTRQVTVIGTGNTPLSLVQGISNRTYFYDGPIPTLDSTFANITSAVSPIASTSFRRVFGDVRGTELNSTQLELLRNQIRVAKGKGIQTRYWDLPGWPISTRNGIWRQLRTEGVDLLNVDDLAAAAGFSDASNSW
ncbi:MAG: hypothetical protein M1817_005160 [Caeruleum heppii]|nr:MAG: hypothetical protein M1817_005160 [Caeruleum heppii]